MKAYKAFDADLSCRGFNYEIGHTYKHDGEVVACVSGFHSCINPIDCLSYYDLTDSRFAEVDCGGKIVGHESDSKVASAEITIKAELKLPDFIGACVRWMVENVTGDNAASGYYAKLAASGNYDQLAASGDSPQLAASGNFTKLAASGFNAKLAASGDCAQLAASGNFAKLAASGYNAKLAASNSAQLAASGDSAQLAASGYKAKLAASGFNAKLAASGYYAKLAASGNYAQLAASGKGSVIASSSVGAKAKGAIGTWISLAEYVDGKCVGFATGRIGDSGLKADTFYKAKGGKLVEADQ